jgi:hypothetical protein
LEVNAADTLLQIVIDGFEGRIGIFAFNIQGKLACFKVGSLIDRIDIEKDVEIICR